jgi:outer membrane protein assembly factor BamB
MKYVALLLAVVAVTLVAVPAGAADAPVAATDNWSQFRGPTGMGITTEKNLPLEWGGADAKNVLWKMPLKGNGQASPIVWGDQVIVCTVTWPDSVEPGRRGKVLPEHHLTCFDLAGGKQQWDTLIPPGPWTRDDFRNGPSGGYAAATPATDGKMIYAAYGSSVLAAVDMQGKLVWRKEIVPFTFDVTLASSPVICGDTVLVLCAMSKPEDSRVIAFKKDSGDVKWERKLPGVGYGHSTPLVIEVGGKKQVLVSASAGKEADNALQSLDAATGEILWWCKGVGAIATPVFANGLVYSDSGRGGPGLTVDPTGKGDVSKTHVKATINMGVQAFGSPLVIGPYVYRVDNGGNMRCVEQATGKAVYEKKLDGFGNFWGSPIADAQGRIFIASAGKSYVVQSGPEFKLLATNDLGDANHASPAVSKGKLLLVGLKNIYCIGSK